jgi:hypothetical protein
MKITKQSLSRIIKEELENLEEQGVDTLAGTTNTQPMQSNDPLAGPTRAPPGTQQQPQQGKKGMVPVQAVMQLQRQLVALTKELQALLARAK